VVRARSAKWLLIVAAGLLAAACNFTKLAYTNAALAYDNAAPMLTWVVDEYVDLSGTQKEWVRQRLNRAMDWHRQRQLPYYRAFFERVSEKAEGPIAVADLERAHRELYVRYNEALERLLPDAADLLAQLDAEQVQHLQEKLEENDRKFVKEQVKSEIPDRRREQARKWIEHLESWVGGLETSQRRLVREHVRGFADIGNERLADRRYRESEILRLVRTRPSREESIAALRKLFIDTSSWRPAEFQEKLRERDRQTFAMLSALSETFTPEQRAHLSQRCKGYVRDIGEITASSAKATSGS
jgi:3-methyladenine DNA glycosylase AlkC